ncbi:fasciclin domain-containing protein [Nonlabens ponticola]|uniref:Fasciclin domain-containing protein n=1 Tax=Nonlabens ponticola TaxID=2496866 RepID=A0A3S9N066_9FLAO|nr:fasciclin domain-containing protein [Nonlabens ponticola]AZQ44778.1 fasciclin domain-containing protein [Nonlabens ponticola]
MKMRFLYLLFAFSLIISCTDEDDNNNVINGPSALDFVSESPDHTILLQALERTRLDESLETSNNLTIFAPNDNAFRQFLAANNFGSVNSIPEDLLTLVLQYHIQNEVKTTDQLGSQYFKTLATVDNDQLDVFVSKDEEDNLRLNNEADVILADEIVSNGVIHVIDDVLDIPSVVTLIAANPDFDLLEESLRQEGLAVTLDDLEDASAPFTVFAPSDAGFQAFIDEDEEDGFEDSDDVLELDNLDDILLYHVLGDNALRLEDFEDGSTIGPLGDGTFLLATSSGFTIADENDRITTIVTTNITAFNGVIHSLDNILLPE